MSKSTRKIVAGLLSIAMVLTLVVGLSATASAQTVTFTRNLTVGSTGADVTALQTFLASKGFFTVTPTGYFGSITKRAVAQYQAASGITPAAGYFGPLTRASVNAGGAVVVNPGTTTPGCPAGAVYNYLTGALCSQGGTTVTGNTEGTLTVTQSASPSNNSNILTNADVPVYGLDLRAQLADVTVNRIDLDVAVSSTNGTENPGNFINAIKVWNGSTLVKSWSVGTADFITGTTSTDYYVRLSNIGFVVPKDTTKALTVSFSTNGGIDNDRTVQVYGYGSNSLLATSGNNVNAYYNVATLTRTHTFKKPGAATLTVFADASNPLSKNYKVDSSTGAQGVEMLKFAVKSETGESKITSVTFAATSSISAPGGYRLLDNGTSIGSISAASSTAAQSLTFNNLNVVVAAGATKTLTIVGDFNAGTGNANLASTTVTSVVYTKPNGTSATVSTNVGGNNVGFYTDVAQITATTPTTPTVVTNTTTSTSSEMTGKIVFKVKPMGGSMTLPTGTSFIVKAATSTESTATQITLSAGEKGVKVFAPNGQEVVSGQTLAEDSEYTIEVSTKIVNNDVTYSGFYYFYISSFAWTVDSTSVTQTTGLNGLQTSTASFTK